VGFSTLALAVPPVFTKIILYFVEQYYDRRKTVIRHTFTGGIIFVGYYIRLKSC